MPPLWHLASSTSSSYSTFLHLAFSHGSLNSETSNASDFVIPNKSTTASKYFTFMFIYKLIYNIVNIPINILKSIDINQKIILFINSYTQLNDKIYF